MIDGSIVTLDPCKLPEAANRWPEYMQTVLNIMLNNSCRKLAANGRENTLLDSGTLGTTAVAAISTDGVGLSMS
jgi:hypothetical protein